MSRCLRLVLLVGLTNLLACGARSGLEGLPSASERDAGGRRADGGWPPGDGAPPDAPRPDGGRPEGRCVVDDTFVAAESTDGVLAWPSLARLDERVLLSFARRGDETAGHRVWSVPLTTEGIAVAGEEMVTPGLESTVVPGTLGGGPGFTLAYHTNRAVGGALFDADGRLSDVAPPASRRTAGDGRPALAIENGVVVTGWNVRDEPECDAIFTSVRAPSSEQRTFRGRDPVATRSVLLPGFVDLGFRDGRNQVFVGTYDGGAELLAVREYGFEGDLSGFALTGAPDGGAVLWGTTLRVRGGESVRLSLNARTREMDEFDYSGLGVGDVDWDEASGFMLSAIGAQDPAAVVVYATDARRDVRLEVARDVGTDGAAPTPAVVTTGSPGRFMVAWDHTLPKTSRIEGALITCR